MSTTVFETRETAPQDMDAEHYTSDHVYHQVMEQALALGPFSDELSHLRTAMYETAGVVPVVLENLPLQLNGHRLVESDQTVQPGDSYKLRGSAYALAVALGNDPTLTDVHIASAGNAANGLLRAAAAFGEKRGRKIQVTAECVEGASPAKVGPLERDGAVVHAVHASFDDALVAANAAGELPGHATIQAFDAVETIVGQTTIGWETLDDLRARAKRHEINLHETPIKLFVPVGGGGLISGIACVMRWAKDVGLVGENLQVYGVQMAGCDAMGRYVDSVRRGETPPDNLFETGLPFDPAADGTAVRKPGLLTREIVADLRFVADIVTVSPGELGIAMEDLTKCRGGRRVEPAGALSSAGARHFMQDKPARPVRGMPVETVVTYKTGSRVSQELYGYFMGAAQALRREREAAGQAALLAYQNNLRTMPRSDLGAPTGQRRGFRVASSPVPRF